MHRRNTSLVCLLGWLLAGCGAPDDGATVEAPAPLDTPPGLAGAGGGPSLPAGGSAGQSVGGGGAGGSPVGGAEAIGPGGQAPSGNQASVVSWNLENFPQSAEAAARAVELLSALAPDVAALQEIAEPDAFYDLLDALPGYDGFLNLDYGAYQRLGLIFKQDRVTVSDVETIYRDDWYPFPRPPLTARITIDGPPAIDFVIVDVHLKAMVDDESQDRRRAGCEALDAWVRAEQASGSEQDFVLLGDFNDDLDDPPEWNVFASFLGAPAAYSALTLPLAEAGEHSYIPYERLIDHVFVTADMLAEVGSGQTEVLALEESVSGYLELTDHRPVRTWLKWAAE